MTDETIVRLKILSTSLDPDQMSNVVGISCDRSWRINDKRARTAIVETNHGWVLNSGMPKTASIEEQLQGLLEITRPYIDRIKGLTSEGSIELSCVVYAARPPALNFTALIIKQICDLGASLDIDLYITE